MNYPARKLEVTEMPSCGSYDVELYDGRFIPLDTGSAQRLEALMDTAPADMVPEINRFCLCITGARNGFFDMPNERWRSHFANMIGPLLRAQDISLSVGTERYSLYDMKYTMGDKSAGRGRQRARG